MSHSHCWVNMLMLLLGVGSTLSGSSVRAFQSAGPAQATDKPAPPQKPNLRAKPTRIAEDPRTRIILEKLELPISMNFGEETPIEDVLKFIQRSTSEKGYSGIPIYVDPVGLQEADKHLQSPVSIKLEGVPLKTTLRLALRQLGLAYQVRDGFLKISTPEGLLGADADREQADAERAFVEAIIKADPNPKTKEVWDKLSRPVAIDFSRPTPLAEVLKSIQILTSTTKTKGIPIYVDPVGLQEAEKSLQSPITFKLDGVPLRTTLKMILKQLGLDYCLRDGLVLISDRDTIEEELVQAAIEFKIPGLATQNPLNQGPRPLQ